MTATDALHMTISIGIAEKSDELTAYELIRKTDNHMYVAKERGRNTVYPNPQELRLNR